VPTKIKKEAWEFIAKYFGDLSKAIITVGFASYFFKDMPLILRLVCGFLALAFFGLAVILLSKGEKS